MNTSFSSSPPTQLYRHHWLAFWKPSAFGSLLLVAGIWSFRVSVTLGFLLLGLSLCCAVGATLYWRWNTISFTPDHRLVHHRGMFGSTTDIFSLFGTVTPYQTPLLGWLLDEGSIDLRLGGVGAHIKHIANFRSFYNTIVTGAGQSLSGGASVRIDLHFPQSGFAVWGRYAAPNAGDREGSGELYRVAGEDDRSDAF